MAQLLEDKVSDLMAQVRHLEKDIRGLNEKIAEQVREKEELNQTIQRRDEKIDEQRAEIVDLKNESEELKQKGGMLSQAQLDLV
jgi:predicted  nucleic acid-binding Zn-ribbon protein